MYFMSITMHSLLFNHIKDEKKKFELSDLKSPPSASYQSQPCLKRNVLICEYMMRVNFRAIVRLLLFYWKWDGMCISCSVDGRRCE